MAVQPSPSETLEGFKIWKMLAGPIRSQWRVAINLRQSKWRASVVPNKQAAKASRREKLHERKVRGPEHLATL